MTNLPSAREASGPVRRRQLIDEAIRLIGKLGYGGFTVQGLAVQCGLTNAGVLHHFGTKDALLLAVLDQIERGEREQIAIFTATVRLDAQNADDRVKATRKLLHKMMQWVADNPELARFLSALQAESMEPNHPAHRWFAEREAETLAMFTQLASHHGPKTQATARQLIALMYGLTLQWLRSGRGFDLVAEWERAAEVILTQMLPNNSNAGNPGGLSLPGGHRQV